MVEIKIDRDYGMIYYASSMGISSVVQPAKKKDWERIQDEWTKMQDEMEELYQEARKS